MSKVLEVLVIKIFFRNKNKVFIALMTIIFIIIILVYNGIIWPTVPKIFGYSVKGIDVARYQGEIDFEIIKDQNIKFVFAKATEGSSYKDPYFERNMLKSLESGIANGAYHFFSTESPGKTQAENFINTVSKYETKLPPVLDFEILKDEKNREKNIIEAKIFLDEVEKHFGKKPIIYTTYESYDFYISNDKELKEYNLWFRSLLWKPILEKDEDWIFWQYNNRGRLKGIDKKQKYVDINVFNGSIEDFNISFGLLNN